MADGAASSARPRGRCVGRGDVCEGRAKLLFFTIKGREVGNERGSMARARSDAPSRADRPPRAAALALEAERGPCDVRSRVSRASTRARRGGPILVWVAPRCGMRGSCAGTEVSDARGRSVRMHGHQTKRCTRCAPARTGNTPRLLVMPVALRCAVKGWHGVQVPLTAARSTLTLTVILNPPSRLHPPRLTLTLGLTGPWRMPRSGHADPAGCPTLALAPGGRRPRG